MGTAMTKVAKRTFRLGNNFASMLGCGMDAKPQCSCVRRIKLVTDQTYRQHEIAL